MPNEEEATNQNPAGDFPIIPRHSHTGTDSPRVDYKDLESINELRTTYNPSELSSGSTEIKAVTFGGARLGDFVLVSAPYNLQGINVNPYVQSNNTIALHLYNSNPSGSAAINLASGTWVIKLLKL